MNGLDPIQIFRTEAAELFEQIEAGLLDLLHDLSDQAQIDAVFRGLHTLKGSGAMFGFEALAAFTHHCETAFDRVRKGEVKATAELVACVLDAQDHMKALVEHPNGDNAETGDALLAKLRDAVGGLARGSVVAAPLPAPAAASTVDTAATAPQSSETTYRLFMRLPANAMANGTNPLGLLDELRELGDCTVVADMTAVPPLDAIEPADLYVAWHVTLVTERGRDAIDDVFIFVMDDMELKLSLIHI